MQQIFNFKTPAIKKANINFLEKMSNINLFYCCNYVILENFTYFGFINLIYIIEIFLVLVHQNQFFSVKIFILKK